MKSLSGFIEDNREGLIELLRELCHICAPSGDEWRRSEYCLRWYKERGLTDAYVDAVGNVVLPYQCDESNDITVVAAHLDTVFPDIEPMPVREENGRLYSPGVGDDTASVAVLMHTALYFAKAGMKADGGILFVCNTGEEGLGNLIGVRRIFKDYEGRVKRFLTLDADFSVICDRSVGSHRYKVEVRTEGGHSYGCFGSRNAIDLLSSVVKDIYSIVPPAKENTKTTYNVGIINGGTSVNTIAEEAHMLCEYRSDDVDCLEKMEKSFKEIFERHTSEAKTFTVELVGDRPCDRCVDKNEQERMARLVERNVKQITGVCPKRYSMSTDCNIPRSLGIPAICFGVYHGEGAHTRGEWVELDSLSVGLELAVSVVSELTL